MALLVRAGVGPEGTCHIFSVYTTPDAGSEGSVLQCVITGIYTC